jgi:hypothetical protein
MFQNRIVIEHFFEHCKEGAVRRLVASFPSQRPGFDPKSGHVRFRMDEVASKLVIFEYSFACLFSFHQLLHIH